MSLQITSRPITQLDSNNKSRWNAAFEPIIYSGVRRDMSCNIINNGGYVNVILPSGAISNVAVGDIVFLITGNYNQSATITSISGNGFTTNVTFTQISSGYVNFGGRKNYHIAVELYKIVNNAYVLLAESVFRPLFNGSFSLDMKAMIKRNLTFTNDNNYTATITRDLTSSGGINFRMKEMWQGSNNNWSNFQDADVTYYSGAAKQLRDVYGSNLAAYVPMATDVGLFNGNFRIHGAGNGFLFTKTGSPITLISGSNCVYYYSTVITEKTVVKSTVTSLQRGTEYFIVAQLSNISNARVKITVGSTSSIWFNTNGLKTLKITDAGSPASIDFSFTIESTVNGYNQIAVKYIKIYKEENDFKAKFLMDDYEPTLFTGYPFDLSFIHSDNIADIKVSRIREYFKDNGDANGSSTTALSTLTTNFAVNRMLVDESTFPALTKFIDVSLELNAVEKVGYSKGYVASYTAVGISPVQNNNVSDL